MPVVCVYAGMRAYYVCEKDEPWSAPAAKMN